MLTSGRTTNILLVIMIAVGIGIVAMLATGVRGGPLDPQGTPGPTDGVKLPGTPITGQTTIDLPGHYYLTRDVKVTGAVTAIIINASEVSLDLGGFTIDGNDIAGSIGINVTGTQTDVTIENGVIKDFNVALSVGNGERVRIDRVQALSNIRGFQIGVLSVLSNCVSASNSETGIYLPVLSGSSTITDCVVTGNGQHGIGIDGVLNVVKDSVVQGNSQIDIYINQGSRTTVRDNTVDTIRIEVDSPLNYIIDNACVQGGITNNGITTLAPTGGTHPHDNPGC